MITMSNIELDVKKHNASVQRRRVSARCNRLCVPGMGMILWGESPLYIFQKGDETSPLKSTSRWQGRKGDQPSERSLSANLRADEQKSHIRPNPWVSEHNITKPAWRTWGMVNAAVVQGRIMLLPGEICPTLRPPFGGSAPCSNARGDWAEVSRRHSSGFLTDEAKA